MVYSFCFARYYDIKWTIFVWVTAFGKITLPVWSIYPLERTARKGRFKCQWLFVVKNALSNLFSNMFSNKCSPTKAAERVLWPYCLQPVLETGIVDSRGWDTAECVWTWLFLAPPSFPSLWWKSGDNILLLRQNLNWRVQNKACSGVKLLFFV